MSEAPRKLFPGPELAYRKASTEPSGLGGWLLFFFFGQVVGLFFGGFGIAYPFTSEFQADWAASPDWPVYRTALVASSIHSALLGIGAVVGVVLLYRLDRRCPRFYKALLLSLAAVGLLTLLSSYFGFSEILGDRGDILIGAKRISELRTQDLIANGRGVAVTLIWYLYWTRSVRVANTFPPVRSDAID